MLVSVLAPDEKHHDEAVRWVRTRSGGLVTSVIAAVELGRAMSRRDAPPQVLAVARQLLEGCELIDLSSEIRTRAIEVRPKSVRSIDAIHLATALEAGLRDFASLDVRQRVAAEEMGLAPVPTA